jgi:hypothetical protein
MSVECQIELEMPREYTDHPLSKQVCCCPPLAAKLVRYCRDSVYFGQIISMLDEESLKDVSVSFG